MESTWAGRVLCFRPNLRVGHEPIDPPCSSAHDGRILMAALHCLAIVTFTSAVNTKDVDLPMKTIWAVFSLPASGSTKLVTTA
jgi:hypothetical protein